jgi:hypothetical protein
MNAAIAGGTVAGLGGYEIGKHVGRKRADLERLQRLGILYANRGLLHGARPPYASFHNTEKVIKPRKTPQY